MCTIQHIHYSSPLMSCVNQQHTGFEDQLA